MVFMELSLTKYNSTVVLAYSQKRGGKGLVRVWLGISKFISSFQRPQVKRGDR